MYIVHICVMVGGRGGEGGLGRLKRDCFIRANLRKNNSFRFLFQYSGWAFSFVKASHAPKSKSHKAPIKPKPSLFFFCPYMNRTQKYSNILIYLTPRFLQKKRRIEQWWWLPGPRDWHPEEKCPTQDPHQGKPKPVFKWLQSWDFMLQFLLSPFKNKLAFSKFYVFLLFQFLHSKFSRWLSLRKMSLCADSVLAESLTEIFLFIYA